MSEPGEDEVREELRAALADRIGGLTAPAGMYETVRRRHRRRQRAVVGGAVVLTAVAVAVPSIAVARRPDAPPASPTAAARPDCDVPGAGRPGRTTDPLPVPRDVPGSLGGDAEVVAAVQRAGWSFLRGDSPTSDLDPSSVRVQLAERVEGQILGLVGVSGWGELRRTEVWVRGPAVDDLVVTIAGGASGPAPIRGRYSSGAVLVRGLAICRRPYLAALAPPGTTGQVDFVSGYTADLRAVGGSKAVPLRPDGTAVFRMDALDVRIRLERAGRVLYDLGPGTDEREWPQPPTDEEFARVAAAAPGDGDRAKVASLARMTIGATGLPVPTSDPRVLWSGRAGGGFTAMFGAIMLPGGVQYVSGGLTDQVNASKGGYYYGLVAPGRLERTVLAWGANRRGRPLMVFAVGGVRAEAVLAGGGVTPIALSDGGGVLESGTAVLRVRVYGAGDRLIGEQVPGAGLTEVPRAAPGN